MKKFFIGRLCLNLQLGGLFFAVAIHLNSGSQLLAADPFTKVTTGAIVSSGGSTSLAWGDFNNDGFVDLYVNVINSGASLLYSNNGNGTFTQLTTASGAIDVGTSFGAAWADYDNDGYLDLFVAVNGSLNDWLYHNNRNGTFTKITTGSIVSSGGNGNNCSWGDYDNDGFIDLFVANSDQNDFLYHNNGDSTFTRVTTGAIAEKPGNSQGGSWGDYDNDGLLDLFISRGTVPNVLYHNLGDGAFESIISGPMVNDTVVGQGTCWGDYDNDGYLDMFVGNPTSANFLYHNNGNGTFTQIATGVVASDTAGLGCGWADYDNDGYLDLFVANRFGPNFLYHNNGDGTFTRVTNSVISTEPSASFTGGWADYDNDGFVDLFVSNTGAYKNALYHNSGNSNAWLTLKLEGRQSNRAAIGAKVRVKAVMGGKTVWQLREISGGGGLGSQNDLRASFGLRDTTNADLVRVEWPSGIVQELRGLATRQFVTVIEPDAGISPASIMIERGGTATFAVTTTLPLPLAFQWQHNGVALPGETNGTLVLSAVQTESAGKYTVTVTQLDTGTSFATRAASLQGPVSIDQQPPSQNVGLGSNVTFQVFATGAGLLNYQWYRDGTALVGANQASLTVTNAQLLDGGSYSAVVSNSYGSISSSQAVVIVLIKPRIVRGPVSQTVVAGGSVTLSVSAEGNPLPLSYRWRKNLITQTNIIANSTNGFFTVTNLQATAATNLIHFIVVVTNLAGASAFSTDAVVTVLSDTDGDGLPDDWEIAHGLDPNDPIGENGPDGDRDHDGRTNLQEFLADTDPNNATSVMKFDTITATPAKLSFLAASNKTYTVQFTPSLDPPAWQILTRVPARITNHVELVDDPSQATNRFYRLTIP